MIARTNRGGRWHVMAMSFGLQGLATLSVPGPVFLAPFFAREFNLSSIEVGFLFGASSIAAAAVTVFGGVLADSGRSRTVFVLGPCLGALGFLGLAFSGAYPWALASLALAGVGSGLMLPAVARLILTTFTRRRRGTAMSIKQMAAPLFPALATILLAPLAAAADWRLVPAILAGVMAAACVAVALTFRAPSAEAEDSVTERAAPRQRRALVTLWLVAFLNGFVQLALLSHFVLWLQDALTLDYLLAAAYLALLQFTAALSRPLLGLLSDVRFTAGRLHLLRYLAGFATALFVVASLLPPNTAAPLLVAIVFLLGISVLGWQGVFQAAVVEIADRGSAGQATGAAFTAVYAGQIAGGPLFGLFVDVGLGYSAAWILLASASAVAVALLSVAHASGARIPRPIAASRA